MSAVKEKETDYKVLLGNVKKETTAKGKCQWIAAILELMITNDLHSLYCGQNAMREAVAKIHKSINKLVYILIAVLAVMLVTNPQVGSVVAKILNLVF